MSEGTVLITGAGGFVGSAVVRRFVQRPTRFADGAPVEHVVALLRPDEATGRLEALTPSHSWSTEYADIADPAQVRDVVNRASPRAILHTAFPAEGFREVWETGHDPLVAGPLSSLVESLAGVPHSRFVHCGSAWVLASGDRLDESAPAAPKTPYARNKARADALLPTFAEQEGVPWINLRLFNLFGRYERPTRLVPMLTAGLLRGEIVELTHGDQVRDFNDVDVIAEAFADALSAPDSACGAVYHIGSGRGTSVRELALEVATFLGRPELVRFGLAETQDSDLPCLVADPRLAERVLRWRPDRDLERRVRAAVEWWVPRLEGAVLAR